MNKYSSWTTIPWSQVESRVERLKYQQRIYRAEIDGLVRKRKKLQRRLILSKEAKLLAVRQGTFPRTVPFPKGKGLPESKE